MKQIVIFDAYGTLFRIDSNDQEAIDLLGEQRSLFQKTWRQKILEYSWLTTLMDHWIPFEELVEKALSFACTYYEIQFEEARRILMKLYKNPSLFSDAKKILDHPNIHACIMSNGSRHTIENAVQKHHLETKIKDIFSASEVEYFKVSPQIYRMATAYFNTGPSKMLFVSSNPWDITGAKQFGYTTVWVNRSNETFDHLVEGPDYEIMNLEELFPIIE